MKRTQPPACPRRRGYCDKTHHAITAALIALPLLGGCSRAATNESATASKKPGVAAGNQSSAPTASSAAPQRETVSGSLPRLSGEHHPVFSLNDNRALAHLLREGGLGIPAGHPGVAKYLGFKRPWPTWRPNIVEDDTPVALAMRSVSWLTVPLTSDQARATLLTLRLKSAKKQGVRVKLNNTTLDMLRLEPGWQQVQIAVPAGALQSGENRLEFRWATRGRLGGAPRAYAALQWLHVGTKPPVPQETMALRQGQALWLPRGGGLAYYVYPYAGAKLQLRYEAAPALDGCELAVELTSQGKEVAAVRLRETAAGRRQAETFVDLDAVADEVSRLELRAEGDKCQGIRLTQATIVMPGPAPKVQRGARPTNVLFWLIDNARADRFKLYNPKARVETPVIDQLGATGTLFERAYSVGTESRVSHASIWTGVYPKQHRFITGKSLLHPGWATLAEVIRKAGLYTAAWTANGNISKFWGFARGWDFFRNTIHKGGGLTAKALGDHTIEIIEKRGDKPFFVYVGTIDPHVSWRGRQPWLDRYDPEPYSGKYTKVVFGRDWDKLAGRPSSAPMRDRKRIQAIYDSTISYNDHHLGRVLEALEKRGVRDKTMVVITADHGEEFWEYGRTGHGGSLRETVIDVPFLIHYPPLFGKGVRVREGVDVNSILATVLDALGLPIPGQIQAASLLPLAQGVGRGYPRPSFGSQYELAHVMRIEHYKARVGGDGKPRVYDLQRPKPEATNIAQKRPQVTRWLTDALSTFLQYQPRWRQARWGVACNHTAALPEDFETGKPPALIKP